ncbi:MAG TPA: DUF1549 and DUF1553 domain-containing protein [Planctomycetota bacterium]|nr:DUF1549 and DUF1553 domain-containing protein [Planctomycetota bacterium]
MAKHLALASLLLAGATAQEPHWAFVPPVRPAVPAVHGEARNDVDRFVQARLEANGLTASPEATRGELLRRVTFDLTGLPPTLEELDAFEADERPDAYERVVDRLLATPAAAEESTRLWLDLSRYADTHGMERDQVRALWRWRDWVLDAYRDNLPFDRFVTEQLAGDLLADATPAQRIASGWNRNNPSSDEGGLIPEEYLVLYAKNRTNTFGTALLGLTVGCAQCHDHKSDPLTQRDYYRLSAYFASFAEEGNDGGVLAPAPSMLAGRPDEVAQHERLLAAATAAREELAAVPWRQLALVAAEGGTTFVRRDDGSLVATGEAPDRGDYVLVASGDLAGARALRLTVLPDDTLPGRGPGRAPNGNFVLGEVEVFASDGAAQHRVAIAAVEADYAQPGHAAALAIDGDPATGWALNGRHEATALHLLFERPLPPDTTCVELRLRHQSVHRQHLLGRFAWHATTSSLGDVLGRERQATRQLADFEASMPRCMVSGDLATPREVHVLTRGRYDQPAERVDPGTPAFLPPLPADAPADRRALAAWLFAPAQPLTARVAVNRIWQRHFGRGLVATPHDFGRLGARPSHPDLLDWLACEFRDRGFDERQLHRLLVTSATYRQSACATPEALALDPDNVWLARMSRQRLPAEAIRDQALAVSGLLVTQLGGPSVKIPQPPGIWEAVAFPGSNTEHYTADTGELLHRRSLYTFWKRSAPPPLLVTLDAPSREQCVVERQETNTPLQVLALWNDEGLLEAARAFGARCRASAGDDAACVRFAFRTLLQREPTRTEAAVCARLLEQQRACTVPRGEPCAWTVLANLLLSLDEALHRN